MVLVETKIKIEDKFLESIKGYIKWENTSKTKVINKLIERRIEF